eukprot:jgi/Mesen1/9139/ME000058S08634
MSIPMEPEHEVSSPSASSAPSSIPSSGKGFGSRTPAKSGKGKGVADKSRVKPTAGNDETAASVAPEGRGGDKGGPYVLTGASDSPEIKKLLQRIDKEASSKKDKGRTGGKRNKLGIDEDEAAKGRVDFVQVDSWGSEEAPDLETLTMKSFAPAYTNRASDQPFYEQLVGRVQLLDSQGKLRVADARPLPPFERWAFGPRHYLQFLADQLAVHEALEKAIAASALAGDIRALHAELANSSKKGPGGGQPLEDLKPTTQNGAYAKYIAQLARHAAEGTQEAETDAEEGGQDARCQLLAHLFAVHVAHLTTGMRVGAKAVGALAPLRNARAVAFYRDYPPQAQNPLKTFVEAINAAGALLPPDAQEQVMGELSKALQKTSLLLSELAVEKEQTKVAR